MVQSKALRTLRRRFCLTSRETLFRNSSTGIDEIIVFNRLTEDEIGDIADGMLHQVASRMEEMELTMEWTDAARAHLVKAGFDPVYGARPLRRAIQSEVEDLVAEDFLRGTIKRGEHVVLDEQDGRLTLHAHENQ